MGGSGGSNATEPEDMGQEPYGGQFKEAIILCPSEFGTCEMTVQISKFHLMCFQVYPQLPSHPAFTIKIKIS